MVTQLTERKYPSSELVECPYPFFDRLRSESPVYYDHGSGMYLLFRHEDILFVLQHHEIFPHTGTHPLAASRLVACL